MKQEGRPAMTVPQAAIDAAEQAIRDRYTITGPDVDRHIRFAMGDVRAALSAAAPHLAAAERERIRQLAIDKRATYSSHHWLFADLLTGPKGASGDQFA
jgi:hypothetical protein